MNTKIKDKTYQGAFEAFKNEHGNAEREYMVQIDPMGFVHAYNKGSSDSVSPYNSDSSKKERGASVRKGAMLVHNHPVGGWDIFSDADLTVTAGIPNAKGIVATSYRGMTFTVTKGTHFKAGKFANAVVNAKLRGTDYNHAVDNWLTANQKRYGYKYTSEGYTNPSRSRKSK